MTQTNKFTKSEIETLINIVKREKSLIIALDERRNTPVYLEYIAKLSKIIEKFNIALGEC